MEAEAVAEVVEKGADGVGGGGPSGEGGVGGRCGVVRGYLDRGRWRNLGKSKKWRG